MLTLMIAAIFLIALGAMHLYRRQQKILKQLKAQAVLNAQVQSFATAVTEHLKVMVIRIQQHDGVVLTLAQSMEALCTQDNKDGTQLH